MRDNLLRLDALMALVAGAALAWGLASWEMMREDSTNLEPTNRTGISTTGGGIEFASGLWFLVPSLLLCPLLSCVLAYFKFGPGPSA